MKAAVFTKTKSGKVLEIQDAPRPVPKPNEVLVRVHAASVNPLDWRLKARHPGVDLAGVVEAIGATVTRFQPGDAVFGIGHGAFAEYACAVETTLAVKPDALTFEQAASIPVAGLTALQGLRDKGHLQSGQTVLINGAAGGVGTFAVQVAKAMGAEVTAVCSTQNVEMARKLGAARVIDYTREDFSLSTGRYDVVLDNVGNRPLSALRRVAAPGGTCVLAGAPKTLPAVLTHIATALVRRTLLRQKFIFFIAKGKPADLVAITELIRTGKLMPLIDRCCPLAKAADAIAYVETGHARAKVVITVSTP